MLARPFDADRLDFTGEQFSLSDMVGNDPISVNYSTFSVSDNGVLVFDTSLKRHRRQYLWMDRGGQLIKSLDVPTGLVRLGRELFYYTGDGKLMAAPAPRGESFEVGAAVSLFEFRAGTAGVNFTPYAVTGDGQRFLINAMVETEPNAPLTVWVNWAAGLKK